MEFWLNPANHNVEVQNGDEKQKWWACPRQSLKEHPKEWSRLLLYYGLFQKGHLPDEGSISSQSNSMVEILRIMHNENSDCDKIISEKEARKQRGLRPRR